MQLLCFLIPNFLFRISELHLNTLKGENLETTPSVTEHKAKGNKELIF